MEIGAKLAILADAVKYDTSCASSGVKRSSRGGLGNSSGVGICHRYTPDGRCVSLLKILLTNYCIYHCQFCVNRVSSSTPRAQFKVDEVVQLTLDFYRRTAPFVVTADFNPGVMNLDREDFAARIAPRGRQLELFAAAASAGNGEL